MSNTPTKTYAIAIVGATGAVGSELLNILSEQRFPVSRLKALASKQSAGEKVEFGDDEIVVEELTEDSFSGIDIAFFAVSDQLSEKYCPIAAKAGAVCIDKSNAHRMREDIPLVVPEVNPDDIALYKKTGIISVPNCTTIPLTQVLSPLNRKTPIKRVVVSSYQAVSGAGKEGIEELNQQVRDLFNFRDVTANLFKKRIAFNVLPCIPSSNAFLPDGSTLEEKKVIEESKKILHLPNLKIAATCVRVPVFVGHSEAVHIEFDGPISVETANEILSHSDGVKVFDDVSKHLYPTPIDAAGEDFTLIGRIRVDNSVQHGLSLWLTSDNLRTGAALNAVKVAQLLCQRYLG